MQWETRAHIVGRQLKLSQWNAMENLPAKGIVVVKSRSRKFQACGTGFGRKYSLREKKSDRKKSRTWQAKTSRYAESPPNHRRLHRAPLPFGLCAVSATANTKNTVMVMPKADTTATTPPRIILRMFNSATAGVENRLNSTAAGNCCKIAPQVIAMAIHLRAATLVDRNAQRE